MYLAIFASGLHILGVVGAFLGVSSRAMALWGPQPDVPRALRADNLWGLAALLVVGTGLWRLLVTEKGWAFYSVGTMFHLKMALFALVGVLELWPMYVLMRHRIRGDALSVATANRIARVSWVQVVLMVVMPFTAAGMARGLML